jgi:hypothetical protein
VFAAFPEFANPAVVWAEESAMTGLAAFQEFIQGTAVEFR